MALLVDEFDIAQEIRMERQTHKGSFLIVEGKSDHKALSRFVSDKCSIVVAGNKSVALDALDLLDEEGFPGVLCLVDSDGEPITYTSENVIHSGYADLDIIIFSTGALDHVMRERSDPEKLAAFERSKGADYRTSVLQAAYPLACLRRISKQHALDLRFQDLRFTFISEHDLSVDHIAMIDAVLAQSKCKLTAQPLFRQLQVEMLKNHNYYEVCRGHDVTQIVGISLVRCVSDIRHKARDIADMRTWRQEIELLLRLAFDVAEFVKTTVYKAIKKWEAANSRYVVLNC
jgi:hypothetical protein